MIEFGTEKTTTIVNGNQIANVVKYRRGEVAVTLRNYRIRIKVINAQDEMSEFIRFTDELAKLRRQGKLSVDPDDPTTFPGFFIEYPKHDADGSYFVVKSYTVIV
jgi:hypothetical protein